MICTYIVCDGLMTDTKVAIHGILLYFTTRWHKEQRYRQQFEKHFDFLSFNKELFLSQGSGRFAIAFDPSDTRLENFLTFMDVAFI